MTTPDTKEARHAAIKNIKAQKPCKLCKRPTLSASRICDRHNHDVPRTRSTKSWFDAGYVDGLAGKQPNPPEAKHSVRAQYQTGYSLGYDAFITDNWNK